MCGLDNVRIELEAKAGGEAHAAKDAQRIVEEGLECRQRCANEATLEQIAETLSNQ